jgi:uncharacterized membrane protein YphA (DoxX/SURF4 family)
MSIFREGGFWLSCRASVEWLSDAGDMAVAYFMAHAPKSFFPTVNGGQLAILFCFVFLFLAFAGGGVWSADEQLARSRAR